MDPLTLGAGAAVLGTLGSMWGTSQTNASNESIAHNATVANFDEAKRNREFQAAQTSAQQEFQERMSNTAHQREMADMKNAGINPILSAKGAGASSPSGASASGSQGSAVTARMENPFAALGTAGSTAMDIMQMGSTLKKQAAETDYIRTQAKVASKSVPEAEMKNDAYDWVKKKLKELQQWKSESDRAIRFPGPKGYDSKSKQFLY